MTFHFYFQFAMAITLTLSCAAGQATEPVLGPQKVSVILIDYANTPNKLSKELLDQAVFSAPNSLANFIKESSYQKAQLEGETFDWIDGSQFGRCGLGYENKKLLNFLLDQKVPFEGSDFLLVYEYTGDYKECPNVGIGHSTIGAEVFKTKAGKMKLSIAHMNAGNRFVIPVLPHQKKAQITSSATAHEFGHSMGASHANLYDCDKTTLDADFKNCKQEAIADMSTIMSGESIHRYALHHSACAKEEFGWLQGREIIELESSKISKKRTYSLEPFESQTLNKLKTIRINLKNRIQVPTVRPTHKVWIDRIYVEYRVAMGFDSWIDHLKNPTQFYKLLVSMKNKPIAINTNGVLIRGVQILKDQCATTYLFDSHPDTLGASTQAYSLYDSLDSFLNQGDTFYEPYNNFTIQGLGSKNGNFEIEIGLKNK